MIDFLRGLIRHARSSVTAWSPLKKSVIFALGLCFLLAALWADVPSPAQWRNWADGKEWFVLIFALAYVLITQFPIPRTLLTLASGVLYGPVWGVVVALGATTISAAISLAVVREVLGEWIKPHLRHPAVAGINQRLRERGWLAVISLRLIPGVPFSVMNYASALSAVRLLPFTFATAIGSAPGTVLVVLFGDTLAGRPDPLYLASMGVLAALGVSGILADIRLPVRGEGSPKALNPPEPRGAQK